MPLGGLISVASTESHRLVRTRTVRAAHLLGMDSTTPTLSGLAPLISIEELSEYLNVPTRTLHRIVGC